MAKEPEDKTLEGLRPAVRGLNDQEIRLNCLDLAVRAEKYMRGRVGSDPIDVANEFQHWVVYGDRLDKRQGDMFGGKPAAIVEGFGHGSPPSSNEMTGDRIDVAGAATTASLRQAAGKS